ncbi:hypothetical protein ACN38_g6869 [Penicillium nordicum]|uniref:Uncharacterized protein n=1 Tax=Penicillium nordicum TaxID=229535 RepID=A0A0M8NZU2_9EURO|nr:hypothetical protein ACN38_g6869 [Penicillium nordicum]
MKRHLIVPTMSFTESEEHRKLRDSLRGLEDKFSPSKTDQFDYSCLQKDKVNVSSMDLDNPDKKTKFFTAYLASRLLNPDVEYDRERSTYPEFKSIDPIYRRPMDCARNMIAYFSSYITANDIGSETKISAMSWSNIRHSTPLGRPSSVVMISPASIHYSVLDFLH